MTYLRDWIKLFKTLMQIDPESSYIKGLDLCLVLQAQRPILRLPTGRVDAVERDERVLGRAIHTKAAAGVTFTFAGHLQIKTLCRVFNLFMEVGKESSIQCLDLRRGKTSLDLGLDPRLRLALRDRCMGPVRVNRPSNSRATDEPL